MFILLDNSGNVLKADEHFYHFLQSSKITNSEKTPINYYHLIFPHDRKRFLNSFSTTKKLKQSIVVYRLNDSSHSWCLQINLPLFENPISEGKGTVLCDVLLLNYHKPGFSSLAEGIFHPLFPNFKNHGLVISYNDVIIYANEVASDILGLTQSQILALSPKSIFALPVSNTSKSSLVEVNPPSGSKKWVYLNNFLVETIEGKLHYYIFRDYTYQINLEEELKIFKYIVDHAGMEFYLLDPQGNFVYVNEASAKSLGYDLAYFKKLSVPQIDILYTPEKFKHHFEVLKKGENSPFITIHKHKDGRYIFKQVKSVYLKIGDKEYVYGFGEDITEKKRIKEFLDREHTYSRILIQIAKSTLRSSNEVISELLKNALELTDSDYISLISGYLEETPIIETPITYRHTTSYGRDNLSDLLHQFILDLEQKYLNEIPISDPNFPFQFRYDFSDLQGKPIQVFSAIVPIKNKDFVSDLLVMFRKDREFSQDELEQFFFFANSASDIVRRFQAEENLRKKEKILEAVSKCSTILLRASDWQDEIKTVVAELGNATGVSRCYIFKNKISSVGTILTDQLYEWCAPLITPQIDNPALQNFDYVANGYKRWIDVLSLKQPIFGCVKDFPEEERELLFAQDIKSIAVVPIFVFDNWWGLIGFDECHEEKRWTSSEIHALSIAAKMIGSVIERQHIQNIIDEQKKRLESIEKLTSLGLVASGIAHEINNPLATISLGVQNLIPLIEELNEQLNLKTECLNILEKIKRNIDRIEKIVKGVKVFARSKVDLKFESYSLEKIIKEAVEIVHNRLTSNKINLTVSEIKKNVKIEVIPSLFVQVIVNLLNNAIDAVENVPEPNISIQISETREVVSINVLDNGMGVPDDLLSRITEPFFTTKSNDSRLGLGLAISKAILDIHGGKIECVSRRGDTRFTVIMKKVI
ncbi:MAG: PAS domain-containing sensor histidine kinase [Candidatus Hydrogenedentes bacterium]|nr:PAS domain-containing sensor histidine kinase [Candidatus Hydrogenedentota bacterium]